MTVEEYEEVQRLKRVKLADEKKEKAQEQRTQQYENFFGKTFEMVAVVHKLAELDDQ